MDPKPASGPEGRRDISAMLAKGDHDAVTPITRNEIDQLSDDALIDRVAARINGLTDYGTPSLVLSLPPPLRAVYAVNSIEGDVGNGGFGAVLDSQDWLLMDAAIAGYELMSDHADAETLREAKALLVSHPNDDAAVDALGRRLGVSTARLAKLVRANAETFAV